MRRIEAGHADAPREGKQAALNGPLADVLRARGTGEMVGALRNLSASAERLADALEAGG